MWFLIEGYHNKMLAFIPRHVLDVREDLADRTKNADLEHSMEQRETNDRAKLSALTKRVEQLELWRQKITEERLLSGIAEGQQKDPQTSNLHAAL